MIDEETGDPKLPLTLDDPISNAEMLVDFPALKAYYAEKKIQCLLCDAALAETFAQGAKVHGGGKWGAFDAEQVVRDLNELAKKHPYRKESEPDLSLIGRIKAWFARPKAQSTNPS